jgi:hypothetical protein
VQKFRILLKIRSSVLFSKGQNTKLQFVPQVERASVKGSKPKNTIVVRLYIFFEKEALAYQSKQVLILSTIR